MEIKEQVLEFDKLPIEEQTKILAASVQSMGQILDKVRGVLQQMQQYIQQQNWATGIILEHLNTVKYMETIDGTEVERVILSTEKFDARMKEIIDEANAKIEEARKAMVAKQAGLILPGDPRFAPPPNVKGN